MVGLRPVVEMMTFNSAMVALDQIVNTAAKLHYMSGGQFNIPIVIRGPRGPASQLAAQHSQSMEPYFYHVPGLQGGGASTPADVKGLLKSAIRDDNPVIFIEAETLYAVKGEVPEDPDFTIPLGEAVIRREGTDVTVVAGMGSEISAFITESAFDDLDAPVERVTGENAPMPYARNLELLKTPSKAKIAAAIRKVCYA